ncbi:uncharacterized protein LOC113310327 [Papaver somniferum]|uniref:uncharacterized protein LOC113310327 n=1 Tax=Papaver somniferum TaxID=3469 RepID=UPI000E6FC651|nr:uncharacterized protein LOC113310327 [Papaver somniferum]XP_026414738.1 uncharacterized protein LOC113310327 [Papaver somniferum]XP_026414739.1 uncharacterized protein LOC113310327 [Papaver somniferum]XP_026414740.1 uncharacterized protein LOC113310327 [Papaver somniferum]XP_026414741.1 uncharacterized protein LOC113310327 [Papaver somniferum]XP_026414742.1 uncharacterized protein LOC113310327 [Papaver somniferum]XP_026414743.1 uncharacterized protein LOC113310327 [Papaver somniferum]XP_0
MEDSSMTAVELLRSQLISERSISKTVRERAEELAKRVMELERQLRFVSLRRKKAEKAVEVVLSILKSNEISDFSDELDPSSVKERNACETLTEEKSFSTLKSKRKEKEGQSGWDRESFHSIDRSISWESCTGSSGSLGKKKNSSQTRRRSRSFSIGGSSAKQLLGKSCRQMKRRETRSALAEIRDDCQLQENGTDTEFGDISSGSNKPAILKESLKGKVFVDLDMKRSLENQARLIGHYEAEENAQREWEEKFRENNSCTPDSCEPWNQSDVTDMTEERETTKAERATLSNGIRPTTEPEDVSHSGEEKFKTLPKSFMPTSVLNAGCSDQQSNCLSSMEKGLNTDYSEFSFSHHQEYTEAKANGKPELDWPDRNSSNPTSCGSSENQLSQAFPTSNTSGSSSSKGGSTGRQNELQLATHHEATKGLGDVLESLRLAKLSLNQEISRLPSGSHRRLVDSARDIPILAIKAADVTEMPIECTGLFRVPTVFQPDHYSVLTPRLWSPHGKDTRTDFL